MPENSRELLVNNAFDDELVGLKAPLHFNRHLREHRALSPILGLRLDSPREAVMLAFSCLSKHLA